MKYVLVGLHASGKHEVAHLLEQQGISCGRLFSNIENPAGTIYGSFEYELCGARDIDEVFENNAYIFIRELKNGNEKYYEGLATKAFDENDVIVLSPDQIVSISPSMMPHGVCYVWLDNTKVNRFNRYRDEHRSYNFNNRDKEESQDISTFIKSIYANDNHILYFVNEDPARIAAILYTLLIHPELFPMYNKAFNC